jgi:hypothetical protein
MYDILTADLPQTIHLPYQDWPSCEGELVEFRLIYKGRLPSEGKRDSRSAEKHEARRQFHRQLLVLWKEHPYLLKAYTSPWGGAEKRTIVEHLADEYARCGYRFLPLVNSKWGLGCALDILFLRRDEPGGLIRHGGDIDNRIKVLLDGLRMPQVCSEIPVLPQQDENPFFCLLEDDSLITEINVTTDKLLLPREGNEHIHDVLLVIRARTLVLAEGPIPAMRVGW